MAAISSLPSRLFGREARKEDIVRMQAEFNSGDITVIEHSALEATTRRRFQAWQAKYWSDHGRHPEDKLMPILMRAWLCDNAGYDRDDGPASAETRPDGSGRRDGT